MAIYEKLFKIQQEVIGLGKDKETYQYSYVTGTKILGIIKPLMNREKLILKQEVLEIENTRQDYKVKSGDKTEILSKVMMRFTWVDTETGEKDENLFGANGQNGFDKGVGSALTYAERYFLLKYFHISTDEDCIDARKEETDEDLVPELIEKLDLKEVPNNEIYVFKSSDLKNWNGKIYARDEIYIGKEKKTISKEQIAKLKLNPKFDKSSTK